MKNNHNTLYALGVHGTREYQIWSEGNTIQILANGVQYEEVIHEGKVNRSIEEQVQLRINSRVGKKLDNGFVYDQKDLGSTLTNQLGFHRPMLAERFDKISKLRRSVIPNKVFIQPKLNGHRCLVNEETPYSRGGKEIPTMNWVMNEQDIPKGITIDGELYHHGTHLQTIASWAKRQQPNTDKLKYCVYDLIVDDEPNMPFSERYKLLRKIISSSARVKIVPTFNKDFESVGNLFREFRAKKFEGAIVRLPKGGYTVGDRTWDLLKVKHYEDGEFECVDMHANRLGWAILHLKAPNGRIFKATAPGPVPVKIQTFKDKPHFIGMMAKVMFESYTLEGIPFQPVCEEWLTTL